MSNLTQRQNDKLGEVSCGKWRNTDGMAWMMQFKIT